MFTCINLRRLKITSPLYCTTLLLLSVALSGCNKIWGNAALNLQSRVSPSPSPSTPPVCHKSLKKLAIYYSYMSSLNSGVNAWTPSLVAADIGRYDLVILGTGNEVDGSGPNNSLDPVLALFPQPRTTQFYGYLQVGEVSAASLTMPQMETVIDNIAATGMDGVLFDTVGFDFKLSGYTDLQMRQRTIDIATYAHSKNLKIMYNAWNPDDLFTKESSTPLTFLAGDKILVESFVLGFNGFAHLTYADHAARLTKIAAARAAHSELEFWGMPTVARISDFSQPKFDAVVYLAMLAGLDGIGWSEPNFSTGNDADTISTEALMPYRTRITDADDYCEIQNSTSTVVDATTQTVTFETNSKTVEVTYTQDGSGTTVSVH